MDITMYYFNCTEVYYCNIHIQINTYLINYCNIVWIGSRSDLRVVQRLFCLNHSFY